MTGLRWFFSALLVLTATTTNSHASNDLSRYWIGTGTAWEDPGSWYEYSNETQGHRASEGHACTTADPCGTNPKPTGNYGLPTSSQQALLENKQGRINYTDAHPFTREPASKTVTLNSHRSVLSLVVEGDGGGENGYGEMVLDIQSGSLKAVGGFIDDYWKNHSIVIGRFGEGRVIVREGTSLTGAKALSLGAGKWHKVGKGSLDILGGTVDVGTWAGVGGVGTGHINQTGGTFIIGSDKSACAQNGSDCDMLVSPGSDVNISGGTMQVGERLLIGGGERNERALVAQTNNSQVSVGTDMFLWNHMAEYSLSGSSGLVVNGYTYVGEKGVSKMSLNDTATHTTGYLTLGNVTGGDGVYNVTGGTLNVGSEVIVGRWGVGTLNLNAGSTMTVGGRMSLGEALAGTYDFNSTTGSGIVNMGEGSKLSAHDLIVGNAGYGSFTGQGVVNVTGTTLIGAGTGNMTIKGADAKHTTGVLKIAEGVDSIGFYDLDGGTLEVTTNALIGGWGNGALSVKAGSEVTVGGELVLGIDANATKRGFGAIETAAGSHVTARDLYIGSVAGGSFVQGGEVDVTRDLIVGREGISSGAYLMQGSANLAVVGNEIISDRGQGSFVQNNGIHSVGKDLIVGRNLGAGVTGDEFTLNNGSLTVTGNELIAEETSASFLHNNGVNTAANLILGNKVGVTGVYSINDGMLAVDQAIIVGNEGSGAFNHNGGAVSAANVILGAEQTGSGSYLLATGSALLSDALVVANKGSGAFLQEAGINETSGFVLGNESGSNGRYDMNGGDLIVNGSSMIGQGGNGVMSITSGKANFNGSVIVGAQAGASGNLVFDVNNGDVDRGVDALYYVDQDELTDAFSDSDDPEITSRAGELADAVNKMKASPASVWKDRKSFGQGLKEQLTGTDEAEKARIAKLIADNQALLKKLSRGSPISRDEDDAATTRGRLSANDIHEQRLADQLKKSAIAGMQDDDTVRRAAAAIKGASTNSSRDVMLDEDSFVDAVGGSMGALAVYEQGFEEGSDEALQARARAMEQARAIFQERQVWQNIAGMGSSGTKHDRGNNVQAAAIINAGRVAYAGLSTEQVADLFTKRGDAELSAMSKVAADAVKTVTGRHGFGQLVAGNGTEFQQAVQGELQKRLYDQARAQALADGIDFDPAIPPEDPDEAAALAQAKAIAIAQAASNAAKGAQTIANNSSLLAGAAEGNPTKVNAAHAVQSRGLAALAGADGQKLEQELRRSGFSKEKARNLVLEVQNVTQTGSAGLFKPTVSSGSTGGNSTALAEALAGRGNVTQADAEKMLSDADLMRRLGNSSNMTLDTGKVVGDWGRSAMGMADQTQLTSTLNDYFLGQQTDPGSDDAKAAAAAQATKVASAVEAARLGGSAATFGSAGALRDELVKRGVDAAIAQQVSTDSNLLADIASRTIDNEALTATDRSRSALTSLGEAQMKQALQTSHSRLLADSANAQLAAQAIVGVRNGAGSIATFQNSDNLKAAVAGHLKSVQGVDGGLADAIAEEVVGSSAVEAKLAAVGPLSQGNIGGAASQGRSALMSMTKPQLVSSFGASVGIASPEEAEQVADVIVGLQSGASAGTFLNATALQGALVEKGVGSGIAQAISSNPAFLTRAATVRGFNPTVVGTGNAQARNDLLTMAQAGIEKALRKSRVAEVSDEVTARKIAEAVAKIRENETAGVFDDAGDLSEALQRQGIDSDLADLVASDEKILSRVSKEYERSFDADYYSDQDVIINDSLIVGNSGNGIVTHNGGNVWVNREVAVGQTGTYGMNGGSLETRTVAIAKGGVFAHSGGTLEAEEVNNRGRYDLNGGQLSAGLFNNTGKLNINDGDHVISGTVINQETGAVKITNANVEFTGEFINFGEYNSDPSTNAFADLFVGATGYLVGGSGDKFQIAGKFENQSERADVWNTKDAALEFMGVGTHDYILNDSADDFVWGTLILAEGSGLNIIGDNDGTLVFHELILGGGLSQLAMINSGYKLYFDDLRDGNGNHIKLEGGIYNLEGGGSIVVTPEPASMVLFGIGGAVLALARRRRS